MGQELYDWYKDQSDQLGVSTTNFMIMVMNEYKKQQTAVEGMQALQPYAVDIKAAIKNAQNLAEKSSEAVLWCGDEWIW